MNYLLIENVDKDKFKVKIHKGLKLEPEKILIPDAYVLPETLLQNEKIMKKFKKLGDLSTIAEEDITPMPESNPNES